MMARDRKLYDNGWQWEEFVGNAKKQGKCYKPEMLQNVESEANITNQGIFEAGLKTSS